MIDPVTRQRALYGLVLAGGKSRRMGQDKALLQRDGQSQLAFAVDLLERFADRVFVSTRSEQQHEEQRGQFEQIIDRYDDLGPVAGILSALEDYPDVDWLVVACDLPNIDAKTIEYLLEHHPANNPFIAYRSSHDGLPEPLCALYSPDGAGIVRSFIEDGVNCPRKILIRSDTLLLDQPNPHALDNVNTPEDLRASVLEEAS